MSGVAAAKKPGRKPLGLLLRSIITAAIFAVIFWLLPAEEVWAAMSSIGWWRWLAVLVAFGAGHFVAAYKWCLMVRATGQALSFAKAVEAHMAGLFANVWLPSIIGGDVVRAGLLAKSHGFAVPAVIGLVDRGLDFLALVLLAALGAVWVGALAFDLARTLSLAFASVMVFGTVTLVVASRWRSVSWLPSRFALAAERIAAVVNTLRGRPGRALLSFVLAACIQGAFIWLNYRMGLIMGIDLSFAVWLFVWPIAKIVALLPISLGGLGVREAAMAALLAPFGVTSTLAIAEALVWQSILLGFGLLAGLVTILTVRLRKVPRDREG